MRFMLTWEEHCLSFQLGQAGKPSSVKVEIPLRQICKIAAWKRRNTTTAADRWWRGHAILTDRLLESIGLSTIDDIGVPGC